jgi:chaperone BCS1
VSTVFIKAYGEGHDMLLSWVYSQPFAINARSSLLGVGGGKRDIELEDSDGTKKPLRFSPFNGSFYFWHKRHLFIYTSIQKDLRHRQEEEISISCVSRYPDMVKELLSECRIGYLKLIQNKTTVFQNDQDEWNKLTSRGIRLLSTVILDENVKESLVNDIGKFLNPKARAWYSNRGIPYRRGYLLYGPPGTGKSSLSLAIAGHFDLDIYIFNLSSASDSTIGLLFSSLPARCVVLLEDVDVAGGMQSRQKESDAASNAGAKPPPMLSLSTLLNVLDGVASQEGRVLIMTTNYIERLDDALIRPGRVDMKIEFQLADKDINSQLFRIVYEPEPPEDGGANEKEQLRYGVEKLAVEFVKAVPELEFSPAEIMSFLLENRHSPRMALDNVQSWVVRTRKEKEKAKTGVGILST